MAGRIKRSIIDKNVISEYKFEMRGEDNSAEFRVAGCWHNFRFDKVSEVGDKLIFIRY